jgi:protein-disulfide isomerase
MSNEKSVNPTTIAVAAVGVMVVVLIAASLMYDSKRAQTVDDGAAARQVALASEQAPTLGDPGAQVHIVEFLDPACETCAVFFPMVKQWMAQVPGQIRLSVRHVAFHDGAEYAIRVLEASRNQGKYWETLEALLMSQRQWTQNHQVIPDKIGPAIARVGLDMDQLTADMNSADVTRRFERDKQDAITLQVSKTPDYYVNGRPLPSFGQQQLADLIREELRK